MSDQPSIVLVPGAWHGPEHFAPLKTELEKHGYNVVAVSLPTTRSPDQPAASMSDDTKVIRDIVIKELKHSSVVVVGHSYGGVPANNALQDLDQTSRTAAGKETYVQCLAFISSAPVSAGECFIDMFGGKPSAMHDLRTPNFSWVAEPGPEYWFFNELDPEEAKYWASKIQPFSMQACYEKTTHAAYKHIPSRYLVCTKDNAFPADLQRGFVESSTDKGALFIATEDIEAGHGPFLGRTVEDTCEYIRRAAGEAI